MISGKLSLVTYYTFIIAALYICWPIPKDNNLLIGKKETRQLYKNIIYEHLNKVINETEASKHKPCTDERSAANGNYSVLEIDYPNKVYTIGEKIYVTAKLFDGFGNQKLSGGDIIRATIWNKQKNMSAPGAIFDHQNGLYTLIFECLWNGTSYISATIAYSREATTAIYRMLSEGLTLLNIEAKYESDDYEDEALCFPDSNQLLALTHYTEVCNFTSINSGMPWFCGKPRYEQLGCSDVKFLRNKWPYFPPSMTSCEKNLIYKRLHQPIRSVVEVSVEGFSQQDTALNHDTMPCSTYNTTNLWFRKHTTGFWHNRRWQLTHCIKGESSESLRNKHMFLLGDSTVLQWYNVFTERYNCEEKTDKKWIISKECHVKSLNFTVICKRHSLPYYPGLSWTKFGMLNDSIKRVMESIPSHDSAIVLIHVFMHMRTMHPRLFKGKLRVIRLAIETLLQKNKKVKIFIKTPHTFIESFRECNDFLADVFTQIIHETFTGIYDKVIVLDNRHATIAADSQNIHPDKYIVDTMVDQMLGYI